ncbi:TusE/DsrC/DsvC family sulfur relay protein [Buchnera aphidicola]|uniref:TusE/DsrC/DsvC family sulfur relay protein n=1 Tax=Buchnera aphidicola TaxID=9 RepID=UPI002238892A|nr:TusE/DsrC/DsvC family sulfur relay protein [Buchnera aphidicola]MCW5197531.1 TusE/DsrC/DsvC family sulfur relay protein [Buchnera aphidicola (Chaitophorus viminalis)]
MIIKKKKKKKNEWNEKYAINIAKNAGIKMTLKHWKIIYFARNFYLKFNISPPIRILLQAINKKSKKKINSLSLIKLFPNNPSIQISKISGIPNPNKCL